MSVMVKLVPINIYFQLNFSNWTIVKDENINPHNFRASRGILFI